eukprot:TRINITY_DN1712_c0_g1_i1.p1 TRINITY_DN1712_c0_g1~~TRINITY_DN1712_c0_g1_i1.p1  ORF type:complete len:108 (+),score=12.74 TRINITY_DN1712_c0_g1_i1:178-501(+)
MQRTPKLPGEIQFLLFRNFRDDLGSTFGQNRKPCLQISPLRCSCLVLESGFLERVQRFTSYMVEKCPNFCWSATTTTFDLKNPALRVRFVVRLLQMICSLRLTCADA